MTDKLRGQPRITAMLDVKNFFDRPELPPALREPVTAEDPADDDLCLGKHGPPTFYALGVPFCDACRPYISSYTQTYEHDANVVVEIGAVAPVESVGDLFGHLDTTQEGPAEVPVEVPLPPIGEAPRVTAENAQRLLDGVPPGPLRVRGEDGWYEVVDALGNVVAECIDRGYANLFAAAPGLARSITRPA